MRTARGLEGLERSSEPVFVVVGVFDGLHLGHVYLLRHLVTEASRHGARPMVITFDHHPDEVITGSAPPLLCDPEERLDLLESAGVGATVVVHFDQRLRETTYDAFVAQIADRAPVAGFLMTPDAAFGYQRQGTPETLAALGASRGFEVVVVPPFTLDGQPVRSSEVRAAIAAGDLALAQRLLGRPHAVVGMTAVPGPGAAAGQETAPPSTVLTFALPMALPPEGAWSARLSGPGTEPAEAVVRVSNGALELPRVEPGARVRVDFLGTGEVA